jgi:hypothetical protein
MESAIGFATDTPKPRDPTSPVSHQSVTDEMDRLTHSFVLVSQQQASNSSSWLFDSTKQQQWTSFDALNFQQLDIELKFFDSIMINNNNKIFIAGDCTHNELVVFDVIDGKWSSL